VGATAQQSRCASGTSFTTAALRHTRINPAETELNDVSHISSEAIEPIVVGHREQLFHLIAEASEIEHTLMCSYLYAAFSLRTDAAGLSAREAEAITSWRKAIVTVAVDEMVHLLLMANLSIALGGRPHFGRPNFPVAPGYFPSGVVVRLTPFSMQTLEHFIYLERPRGVERPDGEGFEHEQEYQREEAHVGLMPSVQDYATVGHLYEALRLNLIRASQRFGDAGLFVGPVAAQVGEDDVQLDGVTTIHNLESAMRAIATIVEQGEGSPGEHEDSHYQRFRSIKTEYEQLLIANPAFRPAWPAAENPVMRRPPEPEDKVFVDHPFAARLLDLTNALYGLLLRFLVQSFGREKGHAAKPQFLGAAIELMHLLNRLASVLPTLPASTEHPGVNAGMTFTMLRGVEPMFAGLAENTLACEQLRELAAGASALAATMPQLVQISSALESLAQKFDRQPSK
jgi:hypothetical protein